MFLMSNRETDKKKRSGQGTRVRRIGVLMPSDENDPVWKPRLPTFTQARKCHFE
jgi:hypothetical protein